MKVAIVAVLADGDMGGGGGGVKSNVEERANYDDSKKARASSNLSTLDPRPFKGAVREY
jgi:hypothetical protein